MADFFTVPSAVDKAAAATATPHQEQNVKVVASEVAEHMSETTQNGKGSNFSMCEIIM
ncbi:hypothetical protein FRC06_009293 [Ceratobasidium sp. 370]|nr:hypothetical protein FRC06_009293 [Ceratobasidium sp. 370]